MHKLKFLNLFNGKTSKTIFWVESFNIIPIKGHSKKEKSLKWMNFLKLKQNIFPNHSIRYYAQNNTNAKIEEKKKQTEKLFNNDFIQRLQANLIAAKGNEGHGITHLSKILTPEAINNLLSELTPEEK